jgi:hypothetical protein
MGNDMLLLWGLIFELVVFFFFLFVYVIGDISPLLAVLSPPSIVLS